MDRLPVEGEAFGRYRLLQQLGEGGMGVVYLAQDEVLNRKVALKLVLPRHAADPEFRSRFAREAETQARMESSHVVRIYDYGDQDGVLFLCTQYVDGGDLAMHVAASGALAPALAVDVASQVLDGLEEAHQAGVVHRDVKPANVLLRPRGDGMQAYLCDFGIATVAGQGLTMTGQVIGSLPWMAPERHYGTEPGPVGDVYSAGCVLWYALTGTAPYVGSDGEVMRGHIEGLVPQLAGRSPFIKRMNAVLAGALAKHPEDRYATAGAMAADLRGLAAIAPAALVFDDSTVIRPAGARPATGPRAAATGPAARAGVTIVRGAKTRPATGPRAVSASMAMARRRWILPAVAVVSVLAVVAGGLGLRAVLSDDLDLADGSVQPAASGAFPIASQPTLFPHRKARGGAAAAATPGGLALPPSITDPDFGFDAGTITDPVLGGIDAVGPVAGTVAGPAAGTGAGAGAGAGTGTGRAGTTSSQAPAPVTQAQPTAAPTSAAPTYRYRCWDSATHLTNDLASCGNPVGRTGAAWIYSNFAARGCTGASIPAGEARIKENYNCRFGSNKEGSLNIMRFASQADARSYLGERLSGAAPDNWTNWSVGAQYCGYQAKGEQTISGTTTKRYVSYYNHGSGLTWGFLIAAPSANGRDWAVTNLISAYARVLPQFQGQAR